MCEFDVEISPTKTITITISREDWYVKRKRDIRVYSETLPKDSFNSVLLKSRINKVEISDSSIKVIPIEESKKESEETARFLADLEKQSN